MVVVAVVEGPPFLGQPKAFDEMKFEAECAVTGGKYRREYFLDLYYSLLSSRLTFTLFTFQPRFRIPKPDHTSTSPHPLSGKEKWIGIKDRTIKLSQPKVY